MKNEPIVIDRVDSFLLVVGIGIGLLTGLAFLLLIGAAVGIGMGGGLKHPKVVMSGFIIAASLSVLCVGAGIRLRVLYGKRADPKKPRAEQGEEKEEVVDLPDDIEGTIDPLDPDAEIKKRANRGEL